MSIESVMLSSHLIFCHPLLLCLQSFPASGFFPMSWLFTLGGQSIGASASVFPMNIRGWSPCCPRDSQESSLAPQFKSISSSEHSRFYGPTLSSNFPGGSDGKESARDAGDPGSIPGLGRSLEKEMATHSSILPGGSHGRRNLVGYSLQGSQRVRHDWATSLSLSLLCTWLL